jgi:mannan endo-1,4-beta-mannosidase
MKKLVLSAIMALSVSLSAFGAVGFTISGKNLIDANGSAFIPVGVSNPHIWFDTDAYNAIPDLANNKRVNCVRVVWTRSGSATRLDQILTQYENYKIVPMVELHDGTGSDNPADLNANAQWYANNKWVFTNHQRTVLINIGNEWSTNATDTQWRDAYKTAITTIRNSGIVTTLVCDGPAYGQKSSGALNYGQELLNYDPQHNLLFSIHMYVVWNNANDIYNAMASFSSKNLPLVIGEFGWNYNNGNNNLGCKVDHKLLMQYANQFGYGTLAWSLKGNDSANAWLDLTTDWRSVTSPWGNDVFWGPYGTYNRAKTASIFGGGGGGGGSGPVAAGTYQLINRVNGKALDNLGSAADGANVGQWTAGGSNNQRWVLSYVSGTNAKLTCVTGGKCLDSLGHTTDGSTVGQWSSGGSTNQQWTLKSQGGGWYQLINNGNGKALDTGGSTTDGAAMQFWYSNTSYNQQWQFK